MVATSKDTHAHAHAVMTLALLATLGAALVSTSGCSNGKDSSAKDEGDKGIGISNIEAVASSTEALQPLDATPSPDGRETYFIAFSSANAPDGLRAERVPGVFKAVPGGVPVKLFAGAPLAAPFGITISGDGQTLFIADSAATTAEEGKGGMVLRLSASGGAPSPVAGTEGIEPGGVEVSGDTLYITGRKERKAGLFTTPIGGGGLTAVALGGPFVDPSGVAVARGGYAFVVDSGSAAANQALASIIRVAPDGATEVVRDGLSVGHPAGIALFHDESALLVSALDGTTATDVVVRIDLKNREMRTFSDVIGGFSESAGLHRARNTDVFAWADSHANQTGTVYVLRK